MNVNPAYLASRWDDYRKRRRIFLLFILAFPLGALLAILLARLFETPWFFYVVAGGFAIAPVVAANYVFFFECPLCGKRFASGLFWRSPVRDTCLHCGKAVGSNA
jgi:hypothetical protein